MKTCGGRFSPLGVGCGDAIADPPEDGAPEALDEAAAAPDAERTGLMGEADADAGAGHGALAGGDSGARGGDAFAPPLDALDALDALLVGPSVPPRRAPQNLQKSAPGSATPRQRLHTTDIVGGMAGESAGAGGRGTTAWLVGAEAAACGAAFEAIAGAGGAAPPRG